MALGISIPIVEDCPVTRGSEGIIEMRPELIAEIAGAVQHEDEWLVLLVGKRTDDGFKVIVDKFRVPVQERTATDVNVDNVDVDDDVVGVMHSHHVMGAFFSGTDKNNVNRKFPSSIVVAQARNEMGFQYEAVGKVKLPCGAIGQVPFFVSIPGSGDIEYEPVQGKEGEGDLGDCSKITETESGAVVTELTDCGISLEGPKPFRFGKEGKDLLAAVKAATVIRPAVKNTNIYKRGKTMPPKYTGLPAKYGAQIFSRGDGRSMNCDWCGDGPFTWLRKTTRDYICNRCFDWLEDDAAEYAGISEAVG